MSETRRIARAAARRRLARDALSRLGPALTVGAGVGLAAIVVDRLIGPGLSPWLLAGTPVGVSALAALATTALRRKSALAAAAEVDAALALRDRLSSALALSDAAPDDPFVVLAQRDADEAARGVRLRDALPIRMGGSWLAWPALGAMAVAAAMYLPSLDLLHDRAAARARAEQAAQRDEAAQQIRDSAQAIARTIDAGRADGATPQQLEALKQVEEQLAGGQAGPDEARAKAAGAIEDLARQVERDAEEARRRTEALAERFSGLAPPEGASKDAPASRLAEALRRGDLDEARRAVQGVQEELGAMDPAERRRVSEQLDRLADSLGQAARRDPDASSDPLIDQGLAPDEAARLREQPDRDAVRDELRDRGVDPQTAERLADHVHQEQQRKQAEEQAQRDAKDLSDAMRDAADHVRDGAAPPPPPPTPTPAPSDGSPRPTNDRQPPSPPPQPNGPQEQQSNKQGQGEPRQSEPRQPGAEGQRQEGERKPGQRDEGSPTGERKGSEDARPATEKPGQRRPGQQDGKAPTTDGQPHGESGQPRPGGAPDQTREPQAAPAPDAAPGEPKQPGKQPSARPGTPQPEAQPSERPGGQRESTPDERRARGGERPRSETVRDPGSQSGGGQQTGQDKPKGAQDPGAEQGRPQPGGAPKPGPAGRDATSAPDAPPQPVAQPGGAQEGDRKGVAPGAGAQPGEGQRKDGESQGERGLERLQKQLQELSERGESAADGQRDARRLREQAQKLLDQMSPEERERMRRWAEQMARERGARNEPTPPAAPLPDGQRAAARPTMRDQTPSAVDPVDIRRSGDDQRVIAEWFDPKAQQKPDGAVSHVTPEQQIREAVQAAERAVEEQTAPARRSDLIRRYFKRLPEVTPPAAPAHPAPAAEDAPRNP